MKNKTDTATALTGAGPTPDDLHRATEGIFFILYYSYRINLNALSGLRKQVPRLKWSTIRFKDLEKSLSRFKGRTTIWVISEDLLVLAESVQSEANPSMHVITEFTEDYEFGPVWEIIKDRFPITSIRRVQLPIK